MAGTSPDINYSGSSTPGASGGSLVSTWSPPASTISSDATWSLGPYTKSRQLFSCPSFEGFSSSYPYGYGYNLVAGYPNYYTTAGPVLSEATVEEPSLMVAFVDDSFNRDAYPTEYNGNPNGNFRVNFCSATANAGSACTAAPYGTAVNAYGRHLEGANASYMDGHVKWNKINYYYNNAKNYPVWQGWQ